MHHFENEKREVLPSEYVHRINVVCQDITFPLVPEM